LIQPAFRAILRGPMRRLLAMLPLAAALACGSPCEDLVDRICACQPVGPLRDSCSRTGKDQIENGNPKPGSSQDSLCERKLDTCPNPSNDPAACEKLETEEGKIACGLAAELPPAP
jgi:hypothetical protein